MPPRRIETVPLSRFWKPRFWPVWLGLGVFRLLVLLPYSVQVALGRLAGRWAERVLPKRRAIAAANLHLCFPHMGDRELRLILTRHFESLGISFFELGLGWWASDRRVRKLVRIEGLEHLRDATREGRGAILLSGHFAAMEIVGRALNLEFPQLAAMYRPHRNPLVDEMFRRGRARSVVDLIAKNSLRCLSGGVSVWYAADQSYRRKWSVLVPFFGEPAMTNAALSHIARLSQSRVVPFFPQRLDDGTGYVLTIHPALEKFPGGDLESDARRVNALLEEQIRRAPEQYYWVHRRFKGRPEGYPDPYAQATSAGRRQALW
jgi:KDO2-lipid IV(A) lauroyltransferase